MFGFISPLLVCVIIDRSVAIRGSQRSYVRPGIPWLETNYMKWSARKSDYGLLWRRGKITIPRRERVDRIAAFLLSVCLLSCRLVCLFWLSSSLPINCVTLAPRLRARERGSAFTSVNISFPGDIFPLSFQQHLIAWADLGLDGERAPASGDEVVRKVCFIGWLVDGWGKIDPRQIGEDNTQTGCRKRLITRIWSKN